MAVLIGVLSSACADNERYARMFALDLLRWRRPMPSKKYSYCRRPQIHSQHARKKNLKVAKSHRQALETLLTKSASRRVTRLGYVPSAVNVAGRHVDIDTDDDLPCCFPRYSLEGTVQAQDKQPIGRWKFKREKTVKGGDDCWFDWRLAGRKFQPVSRECL